MAGVRLTRIRAVSRLSGPGEAIVSGDRMKALLVEDNAADVTLFKVALQGLPAAIDLSVTGDGQTALDILRRMEADAAAARPDYILLDLNLPRRSGLEILGDLKADPDLRSIPVIVLSSSRGPQEVTRAYDLQAAAYFVKPLSEFAVVVESIVRFMKAAQGRDAGGPGTFPGALFANLAAGALPDTAGSRREFSSDVRVVVDASGGMVIVDRETERARASGGVSVGAALDQALENLRPQIRLSGTQIVRDEMPTVAAEHSSLVLLFQNLVGHALTHRVGSTSWIEITARRSGADWLFCVTDRGIGAGRDARPGAGRDLAVCERIVERLGGRIWVESAPGGGAAFFFTLRDRSGTVPGRWPPADDAG
jgi:two-component system, chemotaxis family, response regulator Rcp1